ncbi:hypothetical protein YC2023_066164 [Brassica napus]
MITVNWSCDMEQGHEDTMIGSHPRGRVPACSARDLTLGREGTALASGDRKYSENLRSTIEEHRPCHFRSSTIGGVTLCVRQHTHDVRGCPSYAENIRGCPPAHTGRPWLSVAVRQHTQDVRGCPCVSVCVRQHTQDVRGCPSVHISARCTHRTSVGVRQHTQDVRGCSCVSVTTHMTSVAVHQYTYQHVGPWTQHAEPSRGLFG